MPAKKTKKRNPQDATLRNIRALKKQIADLRGRVKALESLEEIRWKKGFAWRPDKVVRTGR